MKRASFSQSQKPIIDIISSNSEDCACGDSCFINLLTSANFINVNKSELGDNIQDTVFFGNDQSDWEIVRSFRIIVNGCVLFVFSNTLRGC